MLKWLFLTSEMYMSHINIYTWRFTYSKVLRKMLWCLLTIRFQLLNCKKNMNKCIKSTYHLLFSSLFLCQNDVNWKGGGGGQQVPLYQLVCPVMQSARQWNMSSFIGIIKYHKPYFPPYDLIKIILKEIYIYFYM